MCGVCADLVIGSRHPTCPAKHKKFERCWPYLLDQSKRFRISDRVWTGVQVNYALEHLNVHFWSSNRYDDKAKTTLELLVNEANHRKPAAQEVGPGMKLIFVSGKQRSCVLLQFWSWDWGQSQHLYHFVAVYFCSSPRLYREYKGDYKAIAAKLCLDGHGQRFRNLWNWLWLYCIGCSKFKSPKQSRCEATVSSSTRKAWFLMLQLHRKAQRDWSLENLKPTHIECVQEFLKVFFNCPGFLRSIIW